MRLFSYVVRRDYGFAPNPFFGACTLATCKPRIRGTAAIGDWIIGTGSKARGRQGFLVYVMRVAEALTFNEYWEDRRFCRKRPNLRGSLKQAFGDNIYLKTDNGEWHQADSHHSYQGGELNPYNIRNDTQRDRVLIGVEYVYWGGTGPEIDKKFRNYGGDDICALRYHRSNFPPGLVEDFVAWFRTLYGTRYQGDPLDWPKTP